MDSKVIGFDIDGVLYDYHYALYLYFNLYKNFEGTQSEFWNEFWNTMSVKEQDYYISIPVVYEMVSHSEGDTALLNGLADDGYEIFYITSRPDDLELITRRYLRRARFPYQNNLIISQEKGIHCATLGISYFIDDMRHHVLDVSRVATAVLMCKPHNRNTRHNLQTVNSIQEFVDIIKQKGN